MSRSNWRRITALVILLAVIGLIVKLGVYYQPTLERMNPRPPYSLDACGYEKARDAATKATKRQEKLLPSASERVRQLAANEAKATEYAKETARECEDRLHTVSDIDAQWENAIAARNSARVAVRLYW